MLGKRRRGHITMKRAILYLACANVAFSAARDSIADTIYFERGNIGPSVTDRTIIFQNNGRYVYLHHAEGSFLGSVALQGPFSDGSYSYKRTAENEGTVSFRDDDGSTSALTLQFTSASAGSSLLGPSRTVVFSFIDALDIRSRGIPTNISLRGRVSPGKPLIVGFVVPRYDRFEVAPNFISRHVVIRVAGPSLSAFGVSDAWKDPSFTVTAQSMLQEPIYDDWSSPPPLPVGKAPDPQRAFEKIFSYVGAFQFSPGSKDAAAVLDVPSGSYTIVCASKAGDEGGEALVEVYYLP
jgi:hypothetical protein